MKGRILVQRIGYRLVVMFRCCAVDDNEEIVANRMLLILFRISDPGQSPLVLFQVHFQPI
jgi:hypothetical protein